MSREYQTGLYVRHAKLRDKVSRQQKAAKIGQVLVRHAEFPLSSAICLDVGCSSGLVTTGLAPLFGRTVGLDYDECGLQAVEPDAHDTAEFIRGDAIHLPFLDGSVDVVVCAQVYEHVPDADRMVEEMHRVLVAGGLVFFSGPNWLFPIEPHYGLPFLHWLPRLLADRFLRILGRGDHYYEKSLTVWRLQRMLRRFAIHDVTAEVLHTLWPGSLMSRVARAVPQWTWKLLLPILPNFNWILRKPGE